MQAINSHFLEVPLCDLTGYEDLMIFSFFSVSISSLLRNFALS